MDLWGCAGGGECTGPRTRGNVGPIECGEPSGLACECAKDACVLMRDADRRHSEVMDSVGGLVGFVELKNDVQARAGFCLGSALLQNLRIKAKRRDGQQGTSD